jgi:hypothetical protein
MFKLEKYQVQQMCDLKNLTYSTITTENFTMQSSAQNLTDIQTTKDTQLFQKYTKIKSYLHTVMK